jgi:hypothetical protein
MKTCSFFFALILFVQVSLQAQTVSQFRGNDRNGIFNESDLLTSWPETGLPFYGQPMIWATVTAHLP